MSTRSMIARIVAVAALGAVPFMFGANCAPAPSGPPGDPSGSPLPDVDVDPSSGQPLPRAPRKGDVASITATKSFAVTGIRLGARNTIPMSVTLLPPEVDSSFVAVRITSVQNANGNELWQLVNAADVAPAEYGKLGPLSGTLSFNYTAPDLVFETLRVRIVVSAPLAGEPGIPGEVPAGEFALGSLIVTLLPPDAPLTVVASSYPQSVTVDGNGGVGATTTRLRAEILGGQFIAGSIYEVFWTVQGMALTPVGSFEPVFTEDADFDGVDDLIVSEKNVTANELAALGGTGLLVLNVTARDAVGTEVNDVAYVTVNPPLAVAATMTPEVFVGDGELRTLLNANATGGSGDYRYAWSSDPVVPGLFDEVDTTAQYISFRARDVKDLQIAFSVKVTDAAGNTATAVARRGGGEDPNPPPPVPGQLIVSIDNPPTCAVINATLALDGKVTGGVEPLAFQWTGACGSFASATSEDTAWTAPANAQTCALTFTATDKNGLSKSQTIAVKVAQPKVSFVAGSSTTDPEAIVAAGESGHPIGVALSLPAGCSLELPVTVDVADLGTGTALAGADYAALAAPTTVTFPAGSVNGDVQYISLDVVDEDLDEDNETVVLALENATGGAAVGAPAQHIVTIVDDDSAVISIGDAAGAEGTDAPGGLVFNVSLSVPSAKTVMVNFTTADGRATLGDDDYVPGGGSVTFAPGSQLETITIELVPDSAYERDETLFVQLSNPVNATVGTAKATGTIENDDAAPEIITADAWQIEGGSGSVTMIFKVELAGDTKLPAKVDFATAPGTSIEAADNATPRSGAAIPDDEDDDYESKSGKLTFLPGETDKEVLVTVFGDTYVELSEQFLLAFSNPVDATIPAGHEERIGVIRNDDGDVPAIEVLPTVLTIAEGEVGTFDVALALTGNPPTGTVTVAIGFDPDQVSLSATTLTFDATDYITPQTVVVTTLDDAIAEGPHTTHLVLQAASTDPAYNGLTGGVLVKIVDNDTAGVLVSAPSGSATEGGATAEYTIVLATRPTGDVTVTLSPDAQVQVSSASIVFTPDDWDVPQTVTVTAVDDAAVEGPHQGHIGHTASSTDGFYNNIVIADATIELVDNDATTLSVVAPAAIPEGDTGTGLAIFTVTLSPASLQIVTVDFATADGSATTADGDYEPQTGTLTFVPGEVSKQVFVTIYGDRKVEDNESFSLEISNPVNALLGAASQDATIVNDDSSVVSIADLARVEGNVGSRDFDFKVTLSKPSATDIVVEYTLSPDAEGLNPATATDDYDPTGGSITIPAGSAEGVITVAVVSDINDEPNETFLVTITTPTVGASIGDGEAVGTILDDDGAPVLSILPGGPGTPGVFAEDAGTAQFDVVLLPASNQPVSVVVSTQDGTATVSGGDYEAASMTVEFAPGETLKSVDVTILDDTIDEGPSTQPETFFALLSSPVNATIQSGFERATAQIVDNDGKPLVTLVSLAALAEGDAGQGLAVIRIDLDAPSELDFTVAYSTADGSATGGEDYVPTSGSVTFARRSRTAYIFVPVIGDGLVEGDETFDVVLQAAGVDDVWAYASDDPAARTAVVTIVNDDTARIAIDDVRVDEAAGTAALTVRISNPLASGLSDLTVQYDTLAGTATGGGVDYADVVTGTLTIPADGTTTSATATVTIVDDSLACEGDEVFYVVLSNASSGAIVDDRGEMTIVDNDATPTLQIADAVPQAEGDPLMFDVTLTGECTKDVTVTVSTAHGTADGLDYVGMSQILTFPAGGGATQTQTVSVQTLTDAIDENDETFSVNLTNAVNATVTVAQGAGEILDDNPRPRLSVNNVNIEEGDNGQRQAVFTVRLNRASGLPVTVQVDTADGGDGSGPANTADSDDYVPIAGLVLSFTPGETAKQVVVQVRGDRLYEDQEIFSVLLSNAENANIQGGTGFGRIARSDVPLVFLEADVARAEGNGNGTRDFVFRVRLGNAIASNQSDLVVDLSVEAQTATEGVDYSVIMNQVTFPADGSTTSQDYIVRVNRDNVDEPNETFEVRLDGIASGVGERGVGELRRRLGTIVNDDGAPQLFIGSALVDESSMLATFSVDLVGQTQNTVTVSFATQDGTATFPDDYLSESGLLTFPPGTTNQVISVSVKNDTIHEPTEWFFVQLLDATNATIATPMGGAEIMDDDPKPAVSIEPQAGLSIIEGDAGQSAVLFNLVLSGASSSEIAVGYATTDGTASAGADYVQAVGTIVFPPGVTSMPLAVYTLSDTTDEENETFDVAIVSAVGADIGTASQTVTIEDDDPEPGLSISDVVGSEGAGNFVFMVTLSKASEKTVSVTVNTGPAASKGALQQDATASVDYVEVVGLIVEFLPGQTSKSVPVTIQQDSDNEGVNTEVRAERFDVNLSAPVNATIVKGIGAGAIIDDD